MNLDGETGYPLIPAQRPISVWRLRNDEGEVLVEQLILPNLVIQFDVFTGAEGARLGSHMMCSPAAAREYNEDILPEKAKKFDTCECELHSTHTLEQEEIE